MSASRPRKLLIGAGALLAAAALAVGSGANFNSASANPSNVFSAGTLSHSNSHDNEAILSARDMVPGDTQVGTVDIANTGDEAAGFALSRAALRDTPRRPALSERLELLVEDLGTPCEKECPDDKLTPEEQKAADEKAAAEAGTLTPEEQRAAEEQAAAGTGIGGEDAKPCEKDCPTDYPVVYRGSLSGMAESIPLGTFEPGDRHRYRFTVSFPDAGADGADNSLQGASTRTDFAWVAAT